MWAHMYNDLGNSSVYRYSSNPLVWVSLPTPVLHWTCHLCAQKHSRFQRDARACSRAAAHSMSPQLRFDPSSFSLQRPPFCLASLINLLKSFICWSTHYLCSHFNLISSDKRMSWSVMSSSTRSSPSVNSHISPLHPWFMLYAAMRYKAECWN